MSGSKQHFSFGLSSGEDLRQVLHNTAVPNLLFARDGYRTNDLFAYPLPPAPVRPAADVDAMDIDMDVPKAAAPAAASAGTDVRQLMELVKARHVPADAPAAAAPTFDLKRAMLRLRVPEAMREAFVRDVQTCDAAQLMYGKRYMRQLLLHGPVDDANDEDGEGRKATEEEEERAIIPLTESKIPNAMLYA